MNRNLDVPIPAILLLICLVLLVACSSGSKVKIPAWAKEAELDKQMVAPNRVKHITGFWILNFEYSDDYQEVIHAVKKPNRKKEYEDKLLGRGSKRKKGFGFDTKNMPQDLRLLAVHAKSVAVKNSGQEMLFTFDDKQSMRYLTNEEPFSNDGNLNITLSAWEAGQFIVEKNGPQGKLIEKWTPAPDGSQLHVRIYYEPPTLLQPLIFNRLFDRVNNAK